MDSMYKRIEKLESRIEFLESKLSIIAGGGMPGKILLRRDTADKWVKVNPVPHKDEVCFIIDEPGEEEGRFYVKGDGITSFLDLEVKENHSYAGEHKGKPVFDKAALQNRIKEPQNTGGEVLDDGVIAQVKNYDTHNTYGKLTYNKLRGVIGLPPIDEPPATDG